MEGEYALLLRSENPITTLTWFRGDATSAEVALKERLGRILDQNRWLAGRIRPEHGKAVLTFDSAKTPNPNDFVTPLHPRRSPISRRTRLDQLARACRGWLLKNGLTEPLFQITVIPCRIDPQTHFAVLVGLSHVVGDGHTYYKLMSMLMGHSDIEPLIYQRIYSTAEQQANAMGQSNYDFFARPGPAFFVNFLGGLVKTRTLGPVNQGVFALIDDKNMQREKKRAVAPNAAMGEVVQDAPFVSTNDVLTSWFFRTTQSDIGAMAINFRNRLSGHTDHHAGNYESIIVYAPSDYASPVLIRKSLKSFRRTETINEPLPNFWESLGLTSGLVTNWASFAEANQIPGCQEELHIPLYDAAPLVPSGTAVMIIFRAGPQGLGIFMAGSPRTLQKLGYSRQFQTKPAFLSSKPLL